MPDVSCLKSGSFLHRYRLRQSRAMRGINRALADLHSASGYQIIYADVKFEILRLFFLPFLIKTYWGKLS